MKTKEKYKRNLYKRNRRDARTNVSEGQRMKITENELQSVKRGIIQRRIMVNSLWRQNTAILVSMSGTVIKNKYSTYIVLLEAGLASQFLRKLKKMTLIDFRNFLN